MSYKPFLIRRPKFLETVICHPFECINDPLYEIKHPEERWLLLIPGLMSKAAEYYRMKESMKGNFVSLPHKSNINNIINKIFVPRSVGRGSSIGNVTGEGSIKLEPKPNFESVSELCDLFGSYDENLIDPFVRYNINDHLLLERINMSEEERRILTMRRFMNLVKEIAKKNIVLADRIIEETRLLPLI